MSQSIQHLTFGGANILSAADWQLTWYPHDPFLLVLAMVILILTVYVMMGLLERLQVANGLVRKFWAVVGALCGGLGAWSAFFIALLAVELPLPLPFTLSLPAQLVTIAMAMLCSFLCVASLDQERTPAARRLAAVGASSAGATLHAVSFGTFQTGSLLQFPLLPYLLWLVTPVLLTAGALIAVAGKSGRKEPISPVPRWLLSAGIGLGAMLVQLTGVALGRLTIDAELPPVAGHAHLDAVPLALANLGILALTSVIISNDRRIGEALTGMVDRLEDVFFSFSHVGLVTHANPNAEQLVGRAKSELLGKSAWEVLPEALTAILREPVERATHTKERESFEVWYPGNGAWYEVLVGPWPDFMTVNLKDISQRKSLEEQVRHQALHDPLTGLANRTLFRDRVDQALLDPNRREFAVLFLDLDDFKLINDSYGHTVGDEVLIALAGRIAQCVRPGDTVCRLGGDEFAIMLRYADLPEALNVAAAMTKACAEPVHAGGREITVTPSIGIAMSAPDSPEQADDLLRNADMAMYDAKARGKGQARVYDASLYQAVRGRMELSMELRRAIQNDGLLLHYQPVIALGTGDVLYLEALVRWQHPERGLISPAQFIPLAEETGLIVPLGAWVLREACRQTRLWQTKYPFLSNLTVGVNLSAGELEEPALVRTVMDALNASGLAPKHLLLEVTESSLLGNSGISLRRLETLRDRGVSLAIDDFGTGYSSLAYLRHFPFNVVKLDKTFVAESGGGDRDRALLHGVLELARGLGLDVVAEGVERQEQARMLMELGCRYAQGYCFSRPLPPGALEELLARGVRTAS